MLPSHLPAAFGFRLSAFEPLLPYVLRQLLLNDYEGLPDFVQDCIQRQRQESLLRIHDYVYIKSRPGAREADCLAQPSLDPISLNRSPESPAYGETNPEARRRRFWHPRCLKLPSQVKHGHRRRKVTAALLVNALEIRVPQ